MSIYDWIDRKADRDKAILENKKNRPFCTGSGTFHHAMITYESLDKKSCHDCDYEEPIKFMEE